MYCAKIIRACQHPAEINTFYKGVFRQMVREITTNEFDQFCTEVLQLFDYHAATAGKWCTDMPHLFENHEQHFHKIIFPVRDGDVSMEAVKYFSIIIYSEISNGRYSVNQFFALIEVMSDEAFYFFCNHILQLELHHAFAQTLWYTDYPNDVKKIDEPDDAKILFRLSPIEWDSPLHFGVRKK